jgi:hypothetical protein
MPSFSQVLDGVWEAWTRQRAEVTAAGQRLVDALVDGATGAGATRDADAIESHLAGLI